MAFVCEGVPARAVVRPLSSVKSNTFMCTSCGVQFESRSSRRVYCDACAVGCARAKAHVTRSANAMARRTRTCEFCSSSFIMRNPSGKARSGKTVEGRFCSRKCADTSRRRLLEPKPPLYCAVCGSALSSRKGKTCGVRCRKVLACQYSRDRSVDAHAVVARDCTECGCSFRAAYGEKRRIFCSKLCQLRTTRRIARRKQRARLRGVRAERVNPTKVFERDAWRCQLCGVATPRKLRGTFGPNAPEMDHIIPLSAGGIHAYSNVQCACRRCNGLKGAKPLGQMLLFG